ncbi:hypothetical protein GGH19_000308 [Coemansia sp. RSA 1807]|nr:hypothetical protein GGH19_000308 [Coemansia sp. RSA 1807]
MVAWEMATLHLDTLDKVFGALKSMFSMVAYSDVVCKAIESGAFFKGMCLSTTGTHVYNVNKQLEKTNANVIMFVHMLAWCNNALFSTLQVDIVKVTNESVATMCKDVLVSDQGLKSLGCNLVTLAMSCQVPGAAVVCDHPGKQLDSVEPTVAPETVPVNAEELNIESAYDTFPDMAPRHDLSTGPAAELPVHSFPMHA